MNCERFLSLMSDYLNGNISGTTLGFFERHMKECEHCVCELHTLRSMLTSLRSLSNRRCPVDCWDSIRHRIGDTQSVKPWWNIWLLKPVVVAPAAVALAAAIILFSVPKNLPDVDPQSVPGYSQYISAHANARQDLEFSGGDAYFIAAEMESNSLDKEITRP